MNKQTQDFLNQAPDHPMHSQLEPYCDLIRELRRKRYPYRKIAVILSDLVNTADPLCAVFLRYEIQRLAREIWTVP